MKRRFICGVFVAAGLLVSASLPASDYVIDTQGGHAFIRFRISHLGYSWLVGRFNRFSGTFSYDGNQPEDAEVSLDIDPASIDTNHVERDKHLRDEDFLAVERFPAARFVSTGYQPASEDGGVLRGRLTLRGVTREIEIQVKRVGEGPDPWGGYRLGFEGTTSIALADYGMTRFLGAAAKRMSFDLGIEGIRQNRPQGSKRPGG
jgi:polyisoprenoid-binding protein YceI